MATKIQVLLDMLDERKADIKNTNDLSNAIRLANDLISDFDDHPELDRIAKAIVAEGMAEQAPIAAQLEEVVTWLESAM